jgi:(1->4)-alpha-D-glucan 1-alpha-D-glucosylmutase
LTAAGLRLRRSDPALFLEGDVLPMDVTGARREHVVALARRSADRHMIAVAPRLTATLAGEACRLPLGAEVWQDTGLTLPPGCDAARLRDVLSGVRVGDHTRDGTISLAELLRDFPVALLYDTV